MAALVAVVALTDCGGDPAGMPAPIAAAAHERDAPGVDRFEVWVCHVPTDTTDPLYAPVDARLASTAAELIARFGPGVEAYWSAVTHGRYRPVFAPGGETEVEPADTSQTCIDRALAASSATADAVLVIADAQHAADQPGGRSSPGSWSTCAEACAARSTGRHVYLGANDFLAGEGEMPLDLVEHEVGHSLGLPHSGDSVGAPGNRGVGPYDLMADPSSPRLIDPARRDGPDLIAIDRLQLGWLPTDAVLVAGTGDGRFEIGPSTGANGPRVIVAPVDDHRALTIELLPDVGFDAHLDRSGVVVHLVEDAPEACGAAVRCTALERRQQIVATSGGRTLLGAGDTVTQSGWSITVAEVDAGVATVDVERSRS
ncbi:MAG: hypothetical protein HZB15_13040 [Actinobacteria bacterium]|nr:hypothetical protein [Actinomycetota bacterium]